jgi:uncharacterized membrane protein YfcA
MGYGDPVFWLVVSLAVLVGLALGLLGGGGSILAVPLLVYVAGMSPAEAVATSLLVVGVTALAALVPHALAGRVAWRTGLTFGLAAMVGAYAGGRLSAFLPGWLLLVLFAVMMIVTAVAMIRGRRDLAERARPAVATSLLHGVGVGLVTGTVGAGGGFLVVPALVLLGGMPMASAVGTSLLVIVMNSGAGLAGHLQSVRLDWPLALAVTASAVVGSVVGGLLAGHVPQERLRTAFGWFVLAMGAVVLGQTVLTA